MELRAQFKEAAANLPPQAGGYDVYAFFERAFWHLGFKGNVRRIYDIGMTAYEQVVRSYHGRSHGRMMTITPKEELKTLREHLRSVFPQAEGKEEKINTILRKTDAALTIAGLFHDVVYTGVDGGLKEHLADILKKYVTVDNGPPYSVTIPAMEEFDEPARSLGLMVCHIFGFKPGEVITQDPGKDTKNGLNEFLSALVAADCLADGKVPSGEMKKNIAAIVATIEGTIPFRPQAIFETMFERLKALDLDDEEAEIAVKGAVMLANRDVEGFCGGPIHNAVKISKEERSHVFVGGTWQLMPENNMKLRGGNYPPSEFLTSLRKNRNFVINIIKRDQIFHSFCGFPDEQEMRLRREFAEQNLNLLDQYMTAKIASASIVEAVARLVAPDASLKELVGGMSAYLPEKIDGKFEGDDHVVYNTLIDRGDQPAYGFDIQGSPIARYLMQTIGKEGIARIVELSNQYMPADNPCATDGAKKNGANYNTFLQAIEREMPEVFGQILKSMQKVAESKAVEKGPNGQDISMELKAARLYRARQLGMLADNGIPPYLPAARPVASAFALA